MKKILSFFLFLTISSYSFADDIVYYVSPSGDNKNPGTIESPLATIEKARDLIRTAPKGNGENYTICLRGGIYSFEKAVVFDKGDCLEGNGQITIVNYKNEKVVFSGGKTLPFSKFNLVENKEVLKRMRPEARNMVVEFDLKANGISYEDELTRTGFAHDIQPSSCVLFFDDEYQRLSRWPNEGKLPVGEVLDMGTKYRWEKNVPLRGAIFRYGYERAKLWGNANDIWLYGVFSNGYSDDNLKVEYFDTKKKILKTVQPHVYGVYSSADSSTWDVATSRHLRGYYVYNLLEEIDRPGEYFIDRETGKLYFWPPAPIQGAKIQLSQMAQPFLVFQDVSNVTVKGLTFECSRGMGIYMDYVSNATVDSCVFHNLGLLAVSIGEKYKSDMPSRKNSATGNSVVNKNNKIINCKVFNTGSGAFHIKGGDRLNLVPANNSIANCDISGYCNVNHAGVSAVTIEGVGNSIAHCHIHDAPNMAIFLRGNNHLIEYNHFERVSTESSDAGAVYAGRNPSAQGTVIRYNFFDSIIQSESMVCAIYLDDGTSGYHIYSNVFYRCGNSSGFEGFGAFHINSGMENYMANNVFVECKKAYGGSSWPDKKWVDYLFNTVDKRLKKVNYDSDIYTEAYPMLKTLCDTINFPLRINYTANDVLFNCGEYSTGMWQHSNSIQTYKDPGFVDAGNKDFTLKRNSIVFKVLPGFTPIPFDEIGIKENIK